MSATEQISRREQILQALVSMLENNQGGRITTATLAKEVGVSEAALYRHFPSKAKMFEGLIAFIEETVFSRVSRILQDFDTASIRCETILTLVLTFAEKNPGMCRLLTGDALVGETERLHERMHNFFEKIETQLKQVLREAEMREKKVAVQTVSATANLLTAVLEGRIRQYVRSDFKTLPTQYWPEQWQLLNHAMLRDVDLERLPV